MVSSLYNPYEILTFGGLAIEKTGALLCFMKKNSAAKDKSETKYGHIIVNKQIACIKHVEKLNAFIELASNIIDTYKCIDDYNPGKSKNYWLFFMTLLQRKKLSNKILSYFFMEILASVRLMENTFPIKNNFKNGTYNESPFLPYFTFKVKIFVLGRRNS